MSIHQLFSRHSLQELAYDAQVKKQTANFIIGGSVFTGTALCFIKFDMNN